MDYIGSESQDREKVELYFSCRNLKNKDSFSKSDPQIKVFLKSSQTGSYNEILRTEQIKDTLNPDFVKTLIIDYIFETQQYLKFEIVDIDSSTSFDILGEAESTLGNIMGAKSQLKILDLMDKGKKAGKLVIRGEKVGNRNIFLQAQISANHLKNKHWLSKNTSFFKIYKIREDNISSVLYQSENVKKNLNPIYKQFEINLNKANDGDTMRPIKIEIYDYHKNGNHEIIGSTVFSIHDLEISKTKKFQLKDNHQKESGSLIFDQHMIKELPTFVDYLRGGTQISLVCAIDFTASNGLVHNPSSLHYLNPNQMNMYQQAIWEVSQIILNYDYNQKVPLFGFGGNPSFPGFNPSQTLHCFPVNGNPNDPEVYGLDGIMQSYTNALSMVKLNGPTLFSPLLKESVALTQQIKNSQTDMYIVLLILTDGEIHDMDETVSTIVNASDLPLSIIIIGIGNADFTKMEILDGDKGLTDSNGRVARRDLVQFVPFNKFKGNPISLATEVLAELPLQLVKYKEMVGEKPGNPQMVDMQNLKLTTTY